VKVFSDTSKVGKPYQEVALLNSKGESGSTSEGGMIKSQRKKASELGANGIVLGGFQEPKRPGRRSSVHCWARARSARDQPSPSTYLVIVPV